MGRTVISVVIPAHNEQRTLPGCLDAVDTAARRVSGSVEVVVATNRCTDQTADIARQRGATVVDVPGRNIARVRNAGATTAQGRSLVMVDADSRMSAGTLAEVQARLTGGRTIGGGARVLPERWSPGIVATGLLLGVVLARHRVTAGLFWCRRDDFLTLGGFDESRISGEDVDFARRLRALGAARGQRFGTLRRGHIVTSCRKFDEFGDWYVVRNPGLVRRVLKGDPDPQVDRFYYGFPR
ncbi:MAG TPA: glycosyltransferase [Actinomycetota bacterium]|nr:glycosyltransferase [Actinomycetota bacterium]HNL51613.1 glycosyltransferase [Actinomycetota bacterium]HNO15633.1 glycosyltransferase [Actinomycetota bacterium]HUM87324.1 glycosyltransferase [Actinomycetota bacterium]